MEIPQVFTVIPLMPVLLVPVAFAGCLLMDAGHQALERLRDGWLAGVKISNVTEGHKKGH